MQSKQEALIYPSQEFLESLTKRQLIEFIDSAKRFHKSIQDGALIIGDELNEAKEELRRSNEKLEKAESYVEQGRGMVESIMERWYHYGE